eukprot:4171706-Alexandrium_andersonii.AAC.1
MGLSSGSSSSLLLRVSVAPARPGASSAASAGLSSPPKRSLRRAASPPYDVSMTRIVAPSGRPGPT